LLFNYLFLNYYSLNLQLEMLGWKGEDLSPNQDGSIERTILEASDKKRTPSDGAFVKGEILLSLLWLK